MKTQSRFCVSHEFFRERFSGSGPRCEHSREPNGRLVPLSNSLNGLPSTGSRMREWEQQLSHAGQRPMRSRSLPFSPLSMYVDVHNRRAAKYPPTPSTSPMPLTSVLFGAPKNKKEGGRCQNARRQLANKPAQVRRRTCHVGIF